MSTVGSRDAVSLTSWSNGSMMHDTICRSYNKSLNGNLLNDNCVSHLPKTCLQYILLSIFGYTGNGQYLVQE